MYEKKGTGLPMEHWLAKMKAKMRADKDIMVTLDQRMSNIMSCVDGTAFGHLETRARDNAAEP